MDNITLGMLLDMLKVANGEDITKIDEQYQRLKSIEKIVEADYKNGKISKEKYDSYHKALSEYEEVN